MKTKRIVTIALLVAVSLIFYGYGLLNSWQEQLTDRLFLKSSQPQNIVILAIDDASLNSLGQWPWPRETFAKAISLLQGAKAVGIDVNFSENSRLGQTDDKALADALKNSKVPVVLPLELRSDGEVRVAPLPIFQLVAQTGFVNVVSDVDGTVRKIETTNKNHDSFSKKIAADSSPSPNPMRINYKGPAGTYLTLSITDLESGALPERLFENNYVLIGATAPSLRDNIKTPFGEMPGVEVHANALNTILEGNYLKDLPKSAGLALIFLVSMAAAGLVVGLRRRFSILAVGLLVLLAAVFFVSLLSFSHSLILPLLYMMFSVILSAGGMIAFEYIVESKEKRFIRESFQYYLSPAVVEEIIKNPEKLALGGEKRKLTILFSDIRGFTSISEKLSPEKLVEFMNEYLTAMTDVIMEHGGLVDKYIGDAIMAFWGAPLQHDDHAAAALAAAEAMLKKLQELNEHWHSRGLPPINIGIGVNSGEVIVGNMGSKKRFNYTIMGDEVNFASRLEGLNKNYNAACLVSQSTIDELAAGSPSKNSTHIIYKLDKVMVKGKAEPRTIYQMIVPKEGLTPELKKTMEEFEKGRAAYENGRWDEAIEILGKLLQGPLAGSAKTFLERSQQFKKEPPASWNGVYEFHSK